MAIHSVNVKWIFFHKSHISEWSNIFGGWELAFKNRAFENKHVLRFKWCNYAIILQLWRTTRLPQCHWHLTRQRQKNPDNTGGADWEKKKVEISSQEWSFSNLRQWCRWWLECLGLCLCSWVPTWVGIKDCTRMIRLSDPEESCWSCCEAYSHSLGRMWDAGLCLVPLL